MNNWTDRGRSVTCKTAKRSLSLVLGITTAAAAFLCPLQVSALESRTPITAVPVTDNAPLVAMPVEQKEAQPAAAIGTTFPIEKIIVEDTAGISIDATISKSDKETVAKADTAGIADPVKPQAAVETVVPPKTQKLNGNYVNDYLGFTRTDLVSYLVNHANEYLTTPCGFYGSASPTPGADGNLQCEGFIWSAMYNVATQHLEDVPCGSASTAPVGNGGGWVNWAYYHDIEPLEFGSKEEMLASGMLEKGDVIWSFDTAGPYGLSNANHVGFFWGDTPSDDKFWQSGLNISEGVIAGRPDGNQITPIESAAGAPSVWWVFKLSDDGSWDEASWTGLPNAGTGIYTDPVIEEEQDTEEDEQEVLIDSDLATVIEESGGSAAEIIENSDLTGNQTELGTEDQHSVVSSSDIAVESETVEAEDSIMFYEG